MKMNRLTAKVLCVLGFLCAQNHAFAVDTPLSETPEIQFTRSASDPVGAKTLRDQSALLGSPVAIYEYAHNNFEYAMYQGARSGSINSFLGQRGNDVDLAAALIAMYRSQGIPARYAVGTIRITNADLNDWLEIKDTKNLGLGVSLLKDQGIQNVAANATAKTVDLEHVWVEAQVPYGNYRGAGPDIANVNCTNTPNLCHWVGLDPSFKRRTFSGSATNLFGKVAFDYTSYYNAIKNNDPSFKDKNPLAIYEEQLLSYLRTTAGYAGMNLEDIVYQGSTVQENNQLLPSSLPYQVVSVIRRYNSLAEHDVAAGATPAVEPKSWAKTIKISLSYPFAPNIINGLASVSVVDAATQRFTSTYELVSPVGQTPMTYGQVFRLGGKMIGTPAIIGGPVQGVVVGIGTPITLHIEMDGAPGATVANPIKAATCGDRTKTDVDHLICADYHGTIGGYYLIASGGETSSWSQVHRASQQLLDANSNIKIVYNPADQGLNGQPCDPMTHLNCTPYVDANSNGWDATDLPLLQSQNELDTLTGGVLYVAASQYYAKIRDQFARLDKLNQTVTPIEGFLGVVSSTYEAEYLDGTAFKIMPGGLLIDMKGINLAGSYVINPATAADLNGTDVQFELIGHIMSSLEHETWQELTGYDAVSTVRGIQMALAQSPTVTLANPLVHGTTDTMPASYTAFGYTAAPTGFTQAPFSLFGTTPMTWTNPVNGAQFDLLLTKSASTTPPQRKAWERYTYSTTSGLYAWVNYSSGQNVAISALPATGVQAPRPLGDNITVIAAGTRAQQLADLQAWYTKTVMPCYISYYVISGTAYCDSTNAYFNYFDRTQGFVATAYRYRLAPPALDLQSTDLVAQIRDDLYAPPTGKWIEYLLPTRQTVGDTYRFAVDIRKEHDTAAGVLTSMSFEILNHSLTAGGGYVDGKQTLSQSAVTTSIVKPSLNNAVFTDKKLVSSTNNDLVRTPSTSDPVSTVTGNNYHDETDITIKGRGINYVFTRTYNSGSASTATATGTAGALGFGWTHSYNLKLTSNDFGNCPNCAPGTLAGQSPVNGNNKTSSVTFTDERGGDHNYLVDESTFATTAPAGEYDALALDSPVAGQYTLTFRNGTQYVFEDPTYVANVSELRLTPGKPARLKQIADAYGNQLNFGYTGNNLTSITDNLVLTGRTGLSLTYNADNTLKDISDWTGRKWSYGYDTGGNLRSATNPLLQTINYTYASGTHNLMDVILPENRGTPTAPAYVKTTFLYYNNGKAYNYTNALGQTETLDYDLYKKSTRVTDPRDGIRQYFYDANGQMTKLMEPDGAILLFDNNDLGLRYRKYDALGYGTTYSYLKSRAIYTPAAGAVAATNLGSDTGGNVSREQDALGYTIDTDYGIYDQPTTVKDKNGNVKLLTYYPASNIATGAVKGKLQQVQIKTLNGSTTPVTLQSYTYYPDGTLGTKTEYIDPANAARKRVTTYIWQDNGLNLKETQVSGSGQTIRTAYTYDALGRIKTQTLYRRASATDATLLSLTSSYDYDYLDRTTFVTDAVGNKLETVYDANGKVIRVNEWFLRPDTSYETRLRIAKTYDLADRLATETDVYNATTRYKYDATGNLIGVTDGNNHTTQYQYDAMNRRTGINDPNGYLTTTDYDLAGQARKVSDANGNTVTNSYDALGRLTQVTNALGYVTSYSYDANGNRLSASDANVTSLTTDAGHQPGIVCGTVKSASVCNVYDELNRLTKTTDAKSGVTSYTYDLLGNRTGITDALLHVSQWTYDDLGRALTVTDPLINTPVDQVTAYTYDEAGNVLTKTDRNGAVATYSYDALNRLVQRVSVSGASAITENYYYDFRGDMGMASNDQMSYSFSYDLKHRLLTKTDNRVARSLIYAYDPAGMIQTKTDYQGDVTEYRYDSANRMIAEHNPAYLEVSYQYDGAGRLLNRLLSNGAQSAYAYDNVNRLSRLTNTSASGLVINDTLYTRDRIGNILKQVATSDATSTLAGTTTFTYDALYRITKAVFPYGTESFDTYDAVGNRKKATFGGAAQFQDFDADNRLLAIHATTATGALKYAYVYDNNGNMTRQCISGTITASTTTCSGLGTGIIDYSWDAKGRLASVNSNTYSYDPFDQRIGKVDSWGNQLYLLEGDNLEAIYTSTGKLSAKYFRGSVIDEVVNGYRVDASGAMSNYTYHHDAIQSVLGLTGHTGSILDSYRYTSFGNELFGSAVGTNNPLHYTGREMDSGTNLYYYRARYYDGMTGRFISEDPKGFGAGINFYTYANNNPINGSDPLGLFNVLAGGGATAAGPTGAEVSGGIVINPGLFGQKADAGVFLAGGVTGGVNVSGDVFIGVVKGDIGNVAGPTINQNIGIGPFSISLFHDPKSAEVIGGTVGMGPGATPVSYSAAADFTTTFTIRGAIDMVTNMFTSSNAETSAAADGGFVLYPNKSNNNMIQSVYKK